jgi:hypothetical protein
MIGKFGLTWNIQMTLNPPPVAEITWGLYYKHLMIINDDSSIINKLGASLTDDARVIIYDCHMFIVQAIGLQALRRNICDAR